MAIDLHKGKQNHYSYLFDEKNDKIGSSKQHNVSKFQNQEISRAHYIETSEM